MCYLIIIFFLLSICIGFYLGYEKGKSLRREEVKVYEELNNKQLIEHGKISAISKNALKDIPKEYRPQVGDSIIFEKYSGDTVRDKNGKGIRIIFDKDILAIEKVEPVVICKTYSDLLCFGNILYGKGNE